jgi:hypothetical protein
VECRTTNAETPIDEIVSIVSRMLSPLLMLEADTLKVMTSAERRRAAVSKLILVRVESSKKRLTTVLPVNAGTLGTGLALTSAIAEAVLNIRASPDAPRSATEIKCLIASRLR